MRPAAVLFLVGLLGLGASRLELAPVSIEQQSQNRIRWMALPNFEKEQLRQRWEEFRNQPLETQALLVQRAGTLGRLAAHESRREGGRRTPEEVEQDLARLPERLGPLLGLPPDSKPAFLSEALRVRTRKRIQAFLDNLVKAERLALGERAELEALPTWDQYVQGCLELRKREEIFLYAEGGGTAAAGVDERRQIEALAPLDVVEQMREVRRLRGFLGRAGAVLGLDAAERQQLADASDEEFFEVARRLMVPKARQYMRERLQMADDQIDRVLARPYRDLERSLHRLARQGS